ncbi:MAG: FxsA family protein [Deltaproteobacteria bacterium]|nr:FxsA family protein [Deltaproteobacteria bacterium]
MLLKLFLAFTLIPFLEIYLLIEVGTVIGSLNTIALVILTGFAGAYLARMQGMQTMLRVRSSLQQGNMPTEDLIDALLIFVAGIVLLTPGFLTDAAGLLVLFPPTRTHIKRFLRQRLENWTRSQNVHFNIYN